jgi:hypothetical protein
LEESISDSIRLYDKKEKPQSAITAAINKRRTVKILFMQAGLDNYKLQKLSGCSYSCNLRLTQEFSVFCHRSQLVKLKILNDHL